MGILKLITISKPFVVITFLLALNNIFHCNGLTTGDEITYDGIGPGGSGSRFSTFPGLETLDASLWWKDRKHCPAFVETDELSAKKQDKTPPYSPPKDRKYETSSETVPGKINVHMVPHSHDDTGWQVTVDQYYYQVVQYIFDTVIDELLKDENRRFVIVETAFLARWTEEATAEQLESLRLLVKEHRIEFLNGGWCMHDEAAPIYVEMIDQTTRGHQYILNLFGADASPRATWQIDPFGHSNTQAWLLGAEAGMPAMFWGRMDYQDFFKRKPQSGLEWIWRGVGSLGSEADTFSGQIYGAGQGGYGSFFSFEFQTDPYVQDNPNRHDYNVDYWVERVVESANDQAKHTKTEHQMWTLGSDFNYQNAIRWYRNLDKLMHYANQDGRVHLLYSTPAKYTEAKYQSTLKARRENSKDSPQWEVRVDDMFPLGDAAHHYWTGYFTSRPSLKRQLRFASNFLNAARQIESLGLVKKSEIHVSNTRPSPQVGNGWTDAFEGAIGVSTHHDGMSGTERQSVSDDYAQRIAEAHQEVEVGVEHSLRKLVSNADPTLDFGHCNCNAADSCLNITMCPFTSDPSKDEFAVIAWNPLSRETETLIRIPVSWPHWEAIDLGTGKAVHVDAHELSWRTKNIPLLYVNSYGLNATELRKEEAKYRNPATHQISVLVKVPPVGYNTVKFSKLKEHMTTTDAKADVERDVKTEPAAWDRRLGEPQHEPRTSMENDVFKLELDPLTKKLTKVHNKVTGKSMDFSIDWGYYVSSTGGCTKQGSQDFGCDGQTSGAYMFRPNSSHLFSPTEAEDRLILDSEIVSSPDGNVHELRQSPSPWATHVVRLIRGKPYIEVEWTAGPIPMNASPEEKRIMQSNAITSGKELVIRYSSSIASNGMFETDSNGMEMVPRKRDGRGSSFPPLEVNEPVAGNYYPVNTMIALRNETTQMCVVTDATQGGSSLNDGQVELMVHRRLLVDDFRGVQEPLNETMCGCNDINAAPGAMGAHGHLGDGGCWCEGLTVRGRHLILIGDVEEVNKQRRDAIEDLSFPPSLTMASHPQRRQLGETIHLPQMSLLSDSFPEAIRLVTLTSNYAEIHQGKLLLRIAHKYAVGEHSELSQPAAISLLTAFSKAGFKLAHVEEVSLTGNQALQSMDSNRRQWTEDESTRTVSRSYVSTKDEGFTVTLRPMEVRTFYVSFTTE